MTRTFLLAVSATLACSAHAVTFNFSGPSGSNGQALSASAQFTISGTLLTIVLTNTASAAANDGANVLGGVYFDIAGSPTLSNGNAALTAGSNLVKKGDNSNQSGNPLNNEWMFRAPISNNDRLPYWSSGYGIGSTGWPAFGPNMSSFDMVFHGGSGTAGANDDYGIVPSAGMAAGNTSNLYARNSMTFTFNLSSPVPESAIRGVRVSYGSDGQTVLRTEAVPEPFTMIIGAAGLAVAIARRRRARS